MFSTDLIKELNEPLLKEDVKQRDGTGNQKLSYIASHHAINEANRLFGFGNWGTEIQHIQQVDKTQYLKPGYKPDDKPKPMISVSYTCHLKLIVRQGKEVNSHEDVGFGNGVAGDTAYGVSSAIELSSKEAVTDALKRCLRYYGNKFGLSLYDKDADELMTEEQVASTKLVSEDDLVSLRNLYDERGIDDKWVLAAIAGEGKNFNSLNDLNMDWFHFAITTAYNYKLKDIEAKRYKEEVQIAIGLMKQAVNINMLKGLFKEAWTKASAQDDNEIKLEAQKIYDEMKKELEK